MIRNTSSLKHFLSVQSAVLFWLELYFSGVNVIKKPSLKYSLILLKYFVVAQKQINHFNLVTSICILNSFSSTYLLLKLIQEQNEMNLSIDSKSKIRQEKQLILHYLHCQQLQQEKLNQLNSFHLSRTFEQNNFSMLVFLVGVLLISPHILTFSLLEISVLFFSFIKHHIGIVI